MTTAPPEQDLDTIEHLDFEHEIPCEYPEHERFGEGSADWAIRFKGTPCGCSGVMTRMICDPCWCYMLRKHHGMVRCRHCLALFLVMLIVDEVRPLKP
jgi:hypothetical protein